MSDILEFLQARPRLVKEIGGLPTDWPTRFKDYEGVGIADQSGWARTLIYERRFFLEGEIRHHYNQPYADKYYFFGNIKRHLIPQEFQWNYVQIDANGRVIG